MENWYSQLVRYPTKISNLSVYPFSFFPSLMFLFFSLHHFFFLLGNFKTHLWSVVLFFITLILHTYTCQHCLTTGMHNSLFLVDEALLSIVENLRLVSENAKNS